MRRAGGACQRSRGLPLPGGIEFVFDAEVGAEVGAAAVGVAQAFADGSVDGEVFEELVFEANVGGEAIGFAGFFAADEINFGEKFGLWSKLIFLPES